MQEYHSKISAFVGVAIGGKVVYNYVEDEGEFHDTGISIINSLNDDRNKFISNIFESQSYVNIKLLLDNSMVFGEIYGKDNQNVESFKYIYSYMEDGDLFDYYYIYDMDKDVIIIKTPECDTVVALDYKNDEDVQYFLESLL